MDIKRLEYFCSVANHLSFSKAAEECHIAQTAMSRIIASMEDELGFRLFDRNRHKVELTQAGKTFLDSAARIISEYSQAQQLCSAISKSVKATLSIGYGGFDIVTLKRYLPGFKEQYPDHSIILREYNYDDIVEALISGECDVIFTPSSRLSKYQQLRKLMTTTCYNKIGVYKGHPLYGRDKVAPNELNGETFICAYDTIHSWNQLKQFERTCNIYGIEPGRRLHTNSASSLLTMVDMGLGIAFLTDNIELGDTEIKLLDIDSQVQVSKIHVAACENPPKNAAATLFMDYLEIELKKERTAA